MTEKSFPGAMVICPSCGATYHRWLNSACQAICLLCALNDSYRASGLSPVKTVPGYLRRNLEREAARHALLKGGRHE